MTSGDYPANSDWMPPKANTEWQVTKATGKPLNSEILLESVRSAEQIVSTLKKALRADRFSAGCIGLDLLFQRMLLGYMTTSTALRRMVDYSIVWRPGAALIAATAIGGMLFAISRSPLVGYIVFPSVLAAVWLVVGYPNDSNMARAIERNRIDRARLQCLRISLNSRIKELAAELERATINLHREGQLLHRQLLAESHDYQRRLLRGENWRAYRGVEFEMFLEAVFEELGYDVETTKASGDQGVDLIVTFRGCRIAIQAKGYADSVSNGAVQEAHTGMTYYQCSAAAVITNSRFTRSAIDVAQRVGCQLVDEDLLPQLIMGDVDLWSMCFQA